MLFGLRLGFASRRPCLRAARAASFLHFYFYTALSVPLNLLLLADAFCVRSCWLVPTKILQQGEAVRQCLLNICRTYNSLEVTDDNPTISIERRTIGIKLRRSEKLTAISVNLYI